MNRVTVSMVEGKERLKLSMLAEQKELLRRIGDGNVSAGFRRVLGAFIEGVRILTDDSISNTEEEACAYNAVFVPFGYIVNADDND